MAPSNLKETDFNYNIQTLEISNLGTVVNSRKLYLKSMLFS